jgi:hypothetical protein
LSGESPALLLEFAVEVAWRAGRATLAHYQTGVRAETKPDQSPVTIADREAERIARELRLVAFGRRRWFRLLRSRIRQDGLDFRRVECSQ